MDVCGGAEADAGVSVGEEVVGGAGMREGEPDSGGEAAPAPPCETPAGAHCGTALAGAAAAAAVAGSGGWAAEAPKDGAGGGDGGGGSGRLGEAAEAEAGAGAGVELPLLTCPCGSRGVTLVTLEVESAREAEGARATEASVPWLAPGLRAWAGWWWGATGVAGEPCGAEGI